MIHLTDHQVIGEKQNSWSLHPKVENNMLAMHEQASEIKNKIHMEEKKSRETKSWLKLYCFLSLPWAKVKPPITGTSQET